jgi:formate-dependent nitrite reductase membrane component NrfD
MNPMPSSTWFTASPEWGWLIVGYFFFGGLAAGCYVLAAIADLVGRPQLRPLVRAGYLTALPCLGICGILLIVDLSRPERFWHLLLQSNTLVPMFKHWSPMSIGSWGLLVFGAFSFASFLGALAEGRHVRWRALDRVQAVRPLWIAIAFLGALAALYLAGYTGVLLAVTNRPFWSDTQALGLLLLVSAISISCAYLSLLAIWRGWASQALAAVTRMERWMIGLELLVVAGLLLTLGSANAIWLGRWGVVLAIAVIVGMVIPFALHLRSPSHVGARPVMVTAVLVLIGGVLLRTAIVYSQHGIEPWIASH